MNTIPHPAPLHRGEKAPAMKLRPFCDEDIPHLVSALGEEDVTQYLSRIPTPYREADAIDWVKTGSLSGVTRAIEVDGQLGGCISAHPGSHEFQHTAEIGYWITKRFWGNGMAPHAISLIESILLENTNIVRLSAVVYDGNVASMRVLEKAGFRKEGQSPSALYKNARFYTAHWFGKVISASAS